MIEQILAGDVPLAYIIRNTPLPTRTTFYTPPEFQAQVGRIVYSAGQEIPRHVHLPVERHIVGTSEVLLVQQGRCTLDVYTSDRELVRSTVLDTGDVLVTVGGGHGFRAIEDLVLLEVKQGPYPGVAEKERF